MLPASPKNPLNPKFFKPGVHLNCYILTFLLFQAGHVSSQESSWGVQPGDGRIRLRGRGLRRQQAPGKSQLSGHRRGHGRLLRDHCGST